MQLYPDLHACDSTFATVLCMALAPPTVVEPVLTRDEVVQLTRLSKRTIDKRVRSGELRSMKLGPHRQSRRVFRPEDVQEFLDRHVTRARS